MLLWLSFCFVSLIQSSSVFPRIHFSSVCEFLEIPRNCSHCENGCFEVFSLQFSSETELSKSTSGAMKRSARDRARIDLELLLNIVSSETRPTSRHPSRTANANPLFRRTRTDANIKPAQTPIPRMLSAPCARLSMAPLKPKRTTAQTCGWRQGLRAPRLMSAKKDS